MEKETIIELDDKTLYMLLDDTEIGNNKYFFAVKLENETKKPTSEYEMFLEERENGETYMSSLEEGDFKQAILIDFTNNYMLKVGQMLENKDN